VAYSLDLRKRVVDFVSSGGSKSEASRRYEVSLWCVKDWCSRASLEPIKPPGRPRQIDWITLKQDIQNNPDKLLRERADELGVWINSIWYACKQMNITHKKNTSLQGKKP